ncbi:enhancer of mRNA-decapping protein [Anaeramoeba flamelloides]|uniref:Enhancer of mRNA-decapping protein n=1 Tax=Anaeramoeba flamelloides TaxID=1746091 RepID=A0AAV7YKB5_9EUKA|nr:enhancer of mRNA-decapping protein [Anaeramoeba flamelloides]
MYLKDNEENEKTQLKDKKEKVGKKSAKILFQDDFQNDNNGQFLDISESLPNQFQNGGENDFSNVKNKTIQKRSEKKNKNGDKKKNKNGNKKENKNIKETEIQYLEENNHKKNRKANDNFVEETQKKTKTGGKGNGKKKEENVNKVKNDDDDYNSKEVGEDEKLFNDFLKSNEDISLTGEDYKELFQSLTEHIFTVQSRLFDNLINLVDGLEHQQKSKLSLIKKPQSARKKFRKFKNSLKCDPEQELFDKLQGIIIESIKQNNLEEKINKQYLNEGQSIDGLLSVVSDLIIDHLISKKQKKGNKNNELSYELQSIFGTQITKEMEQLIERYTLKLFKDNYQSILKSKFTQASNEIVETLKPKLKKQMEYNQQNLNTMEIINNQLSETTTKSLNKIVSTSEEINHEIQMNLKTQQIRKTGFQREKEMIEEFLSGKQYQQAFETVFKLKKLDLAIWICSKIDSSYLLDNINDFKIENIVFLIQSLSTNLRYQTKIKLNWLTNCFLNISPMEELNQIIEKLFKKLEKLQIEFQNDFQIQENCLILYHIVNSFRGQNQL